MRKFLVVLFFTQQLFAGSKIDGLDSLSLNERSQLRIFFRKGVEIEGLGYSLFFSNKPVCLYPISKLKNQSYRARIAAKGWEVWKKHENSFCHENYLFFEERAPFSASVQHIFIVNKSALYRCLQIYYKEFAEILGDTFSPEAFVSELKEKKQLRALIKNDEMLLGILLGYGKESASNCKKSKINGGSVDKNKMQAIPVIRKRNVICKGKYSTHIKGGGIGPVRWIGDPNSDEVQKLVFEYQKEQVHLKKIYRRKDFLKVTLAQLAFVPS